MMIEFERTVEVAVSAQALWDWHAAAGAFERLMPPWQRLQVEALPEGLRTGDGPVFSLRLGPFKRTWEAHHEWVEWPEVFIDVQRSGPFRHWRHEHRIQSLGESRSRLVDKVICSLPASLEGIPWVRRMATRELERLFSFRHQRMLQDIGRGTASQPGQGQTLLVTGSTGLIGQRLVPYLKNRGYQVRGLTRSPSEDNEFKWDPARGEMDPAALDQVDVVIHLAGENIAGGRWTERRKRRILQSRIDGTRTLVQAMQAASPRPRALVSASGVSPGFLGHVCQQWESEALKAQQAGIRTVCVRTPAVLDPSGGALGRMLPAFKLGMGGPLGSGRQRFPWIAMDDLLDHYVRAVEDPAMTGPVMAVHPQVISQGDFARCLGRVLRRPAVFPVPAWVIRFLFGQMGEEVLLADVAIPFDKVSAAGHTFRFDDLEDALCFMLGRS